MSQAVDKIGAADYLGVSGSTVTYRINHGTFPKPDSVSNGTEWWNIETLDKYVKALARKKVKK